MTCTMDVWAKKKFPVPGNYFCLCAPAQQDMPQLKCLCPGLFNYIFLIIHKMLAVTDNNKLRFKPRSIALNKTVSEMTKEAPEMAHTYILCKATFPNLKNLSSSKSDSRWPTMFLVKMATIYSTAAKKYWNMLVCFQNLQRPGRCYLNSILHFFLLLLPCQLGNVILFHLKF